MNLARKTYWSGKYKDIQKDCYFVPTEPFSGKLMKLNKMSLNEWDNMLQVGISKCGKY